MKVKNIMFFGFAAAILSAGAASAAVTHPTTTNYGADKTVADTDRKIVTSKAYVDTSTNKLAQDIRAINIPTTTSDLTNDSGYITSADVPDAYDDTALAARVTANEGAISTINASDPMNSGITAAKVSQYNAYATNKQDKSDSTVANGTYNIITQGTGVGANLQALDTRIGAVPANSNVMAEIAAAQSAATGAIHNGTLTVNSGRTGNAISSAYTANSENGATVTINDVPEKPNTCTDTNPCALVTDDTGNWVWLAMAQPGA